MYIIASRMPAPPLQNLRFFTILTPIMKQFFTFEARARPGPFGSPPSDLSKTNKNTVFFTLFGLDPPFC